IFGVGDGSFLEVAQTIPTSADGDQEPSALAVARLDSDTTDDLAVANFEQFSDLIVTGLYGRPNRTFRRQSFTAPFKLAALGLADFDADGNVDALFAAGESGSQSVALGDGLGGFLTPIGLAGLPPDPMRAVAIGDVNGDGKPDAAFLSEDGSTVRVVLNDSHPACAG